MQIRMQTPMRWLGGALKAGWELLGDRRSSNFWKERIELYKLHTKRPVCSIGWVQYCDRVIETLNLYTHGTHQDAHTDFLQQNTGRSEEETKSNYPADKSESNWIMKALYPQDTALFIQLIVFARLMWTKSRSIQANKGACWLQFIFVKSIAVCKRRLADYVCSSSCSPRPENVNFLNVKILSRLSFGFCLEFL